MPGKIEGAVVAISPAGNLVTDISASQLQGISQQELITVTCDDHETIGIFALDHGEPPATLLAVLGNSGFLELEIVGDSAKLMLGVDIGARVEVRW